MSNGSLKDVAETWEALAQIDPLWAVLSEPGKQGRKWNIGEFLQTGEREIADLLREIESFGHQERTDALDFGCGVGRLSIPLSSRFNQVVGVDISPTMIKTARELASGRGNIRFMVNARDDLADLHSQSFDFVYSNIVLQHMDPSLAHGYIREFFRLVRPGGFVVFQIPSHLTDEWLPHGNDGTRLPDEAHLAQIEIIDPPTEAWAGSVIPVRARIRNESSIEWLQDLTNQINLGNHWLDGLGNEVQHDDARMRLPSRLAPGISCEIALQVTIPGRPGQYTLELDIVQEGISWFSEWGSPTAQTTIDVRAQPTLEKNPRHGAPPPESDYPTFVMKGIPEQDVVALVTECGAEVLSEHSFVTEWISYRYVTRRL